MEGVEPSFNSGLSVADDDDDDDDDDMLPELSLNKHAHTHTHRHLSNYNTILGRILLLPCFRLQYLIDKKISHE